MKPKISSPRVVSSRLTIPLDLLNTSLSGPFTTPANSPTDALPPASLPLPRSPATAVEPKAIHRVEHTTRQTRRSPGKSPGKAISGRQGHLSASSPNQKNLARALLAASTDATLGHKVLEASTVGNLANLMSALQQGADPNYADSKNRTGIHFACVGGHIDVLQSLIEHGARLDPQDVNGNTPLHLAVASNRMNCVLALIRAGADISATDKFSRTPLQLVQGRLRLLTDMNANIQSPQSLIAEVRELVEVLAVCTNRKASQPRPVVSFSIDPDTLAAKLARISTNDDALDAILEVQQMLDSMDLGGQSSPI